MAFSLKNWLNKGEGSPTVINAAALKDMESRLSAYSETVANALVVGSSAIATGAVTAVKIGSEAVEEAKLKAEAVSTQKLANLAVTTAKLAETAVTNAKLAENAVTEAKVSDGSISSRKWKPTFAEVKQTSGSTLNTSLTLIPGTTKNFTVPVESIALITIIGAFENGGGISAYNQASFYLDGSAVGPAAIWQSIYFETGSSSFTTTATVAQSFFVTLPAGERKFELKGMSNGGGKSITGSTGYTYLIWAK